MTKDKIDALVDELRETLVHYKWIIREPYILADTILAIQSLQGELDEAVELMKHQAYPNTKVLAFLKKMEKK